MCVPSTCRSQKRVLDSLELELQTLRHTVWMLGISPMSSARAARVPTTEQSLHTLNHVSWIVVGLMFMLADCYENVQVTGLFLRTRVISAIPLLDPLDAVVWNNSMEAAKNQSLEGEKYWGTPWIASHVLQTLFCTWRSMQDVITAAWVNLDKTIKRNFQLNHRLIEKILWFQVISFYNCLNRLDL